jgi:hypothetical protein
MFRVATIECHTNVLWTRTVFCNRIPIIIIGAGYVIEYQTTVLSIVPIISYHDQLSDHGGRTIGVNKQRLSFTVTTRKIRECVMNCVRVSRFNHA